MRIPVLRGIIDRRILVNYRIDPNVLAGILPPPFRPQLVGPSGIGGICLIRLKHIRPRFFPTFIGLASENAAHRIAVEWDGHNGEVQRGVFIPRRDSNSRLSALVGGRLFPGTHHHARFRIDEHDGEYRISVDSDDGETHIALSGQLAESLSEGSAFGTIKQASEFFHRGSLGYSASKAPYEFDGLELCDLNWSIAPLAIDQLESSFFDDRERFPSHAIEYDSAFLMRGIEHEWHARGRLCCSEGICREAVAQSPVYS
jgi:hypothetical protein